MSKKSKVVPISKEKTIPITLRRLLSDDFSKAFKTLFVTPMKSHEAMKLKRIAPLVAAAAATFARQGKKVFESYAEKDEAGVIQFVDEGKTQYRIPADKQDVCNEEIAKLLDDTIDFPVFSISAFQRGSISGVSLETPVTAEMLVALDGVIVGGN